MSGFSAEWLSLREPLDLAARNHDVEAAFFEQLPACRCRLLDLASGAGSTVAALEGKLPGPADWLLTDYDPALLEVADDRWRGQVRGELTYRRIDLSAELEELPFAEVDAVTTSAFLDLVSEDFLHRLVGCVAGAGKPFLASLSYDGRNRISPVQPLDEALRAAMNSDQRSDKGFGPALGPESASTAMGLFEQAGYRVVQGPSDWHVGGSSGDFLIDFLGGVHGVGRKAGLDPAELDAWWEDRSSRIGAGDLDLMVGHVDFAAFPDLSMR